MEFLNRDAILGAEDRSYDVVDCPEWGGAVRIRSITGAQRDAYEQSLIQQRGGNRQMNMRNARAKLIVLCAVDEHGTSLFSEQDVNALGRKNAKPLDRLFDACKVIAGLTEDDVDKLTEDFGATQGDDSATD
ncbi:hypothetical protein AB0C02_30405 [Micromonospora sp. NPDC048999]|uniref:hypothetical protein n=1 Tax=Micromonospora sp. NPDC048999 TaxID=3155391 RepID=UPI0033D8D48A